MMEFLFKHHPNTGDPKTALKADLERANIKDTSIQFEELSTQPNGSKFYRVIVE